MTVNLKPGMTAIRRDGERVGPGYASFGKEYPMVFGGFGYTLAGQWDLSREDHRDIIAAGFPWTELGAQVGDTVRCVWSGYSKQADDTVFTLADADTFHPDSLLVIEARAAKPADSEIEWDEWKIGGAPINSDAMQVERIGTSVRHRLPKQKPDEVINYFANIPEVPLCKLRAENDTHRFTLTFPPGSNTGTVEREKL